MCKHRFFTPRVGKFYQDGFKNGKKLLVVGASFYCPIKDCPHYDECTQFDQIQQRWRTSDFEAKCPPYMKNDIRLSDCPTNEIVDSSAKSYTRFTELMLWYLNQGKPSDDNAYYEFWDKVAFTNYIQHMIGYRTTTLASDISEHDMDAFLETLDECEPDVVVIWGCVINKPFINFHMPEDPTFVNDFDPKDYYLFHWTYKGRKITFVSFYHPSSGVFYTDKEWNQMYEVLDKAFGQ